jgi:hypothetical protein
MTRITRVEVIDENGRSYVNWEEDNDITLSYQDDGRTLKVFVNMMKPKTPAEEAYKKVYGAYPPTTPSVSNFEDTRWSVFQAGYNASQEPEKEQQIKELVRESVKWCEEHPNESVEDWVKPREPDDKNFKNSLDLIREWGEKNKPPTLKELLWEWWEDIFTRNSDLDADASIDILVDMIDKKFIPPSSDRNGYEWEKCLKMMREKLR